LAPLQTDWLEGVVTVGVGFTVIVKVWAVPVQPLELAATLKAPWIGELPELVAVKALIFPVPDVAVPIEALLLVQL